MKLPEHVWTAFASHYDLRLNGRSDARTLSKSLAEVEQAVSCSLPGYYFDHPTLRPGNGPRILYHGNRTQDVLVITHGFTDSPFYVQAIAARFFAAGFNVIQPLLPAHGLREPDAVIRDEALDTRWRKTLDHSIEVAALLGDRISLGGFSTGGTLSLNKVLRSPEQIEGGLFLFSAALSLGKVVDWVGHHEWTEWVVGFFSDRKAVAGDGPDPYKYPILPVSVASEIVEIIQENKNLLEQNQEWRWPVFAAHSEHDATAEIQGVKDFLANVVPQELQSFFRIEEEVMHAALPLEFDVPIDLDKIVLGKGEKADLEQKRKEWLTNVRANPFFGSMMDQALGFYRERIA